VAFTLSVVGFQGGFLLLGTHAFGQFRILHSGQPFQLITDGNALVLCLFVVIDLKVVVGRHDGPRFYKVEQSGDYLALQICTSAV
jgi:hypothetical protein